MIEIERKFLIQNTDFLDNIKGTRITQGYLNTDKERTVRVRIKGNCGYITIKGIGNDTGMSRFEWEKEIQIVEAEDLLELVLPGIIDKTRYEIDYNGFTYEVDVFHGENNGLILAELELQDEKDSFEKPEWLGIEVTGIHKYYNSYLSVNPYIKW